MQTHEPGTSPNDVAGLWGGRGTGKPCDLCHKPIREDQVEYEVELRSRVRGRFHITCFDEWQQQISKKKP